MTHLLCYGFAAILLAGVAQAASIPSNTTTTSYHCTEVDGVGVFYREAEPKDAPTIVLLHGFPSSSCEFNTLIPLLVTQHCILRAPAPAQATVANDQTVTAMPPLNARHNRQSTSVPFVS